MGSGMGGLLAWRPFASECKFGTFFCLLTDTIPNTIILGHGSVDEGVHNREVRCVVEDADQVADGVLGSPSMLGRVFIYTRGTYNGRPYFS